MKTEELMIGNWVSSRELGAFQIEHGWQIDELYELEPIALTPELLEKCGWKLDRPDGKWYGHGLVIYSRGIYWNFNQVGFCIRIKDFQYLHQLQNLFYLLSGEHLTIPQETMN